MLAVATAIVVFGIKQYYVYRIDTDAATVQNNVQQLFQALASYYQANCSCQYELTTPGQICTATLDPRNSTPPASNFHIDITNDLNNPGYNFLQHWPFPTNSIVDNTAGVGTNGYVVQLNQYTATRNVYTSGSPLANPLSVGTIVLWQEQVAVKLKNPTLANYYKSLLLGDCTSNANGNIVTPCSAGSSGPYVVWERLPSLSATYSPSPFWVSMPAVSQFNQMYSTVNYLSNTQITGNGSATQNQYYLCGS